MIRKAEFNDKEKLVPIFEKYKTNFSILYNYDEIINNNNYEIYLYFEQQSIVGFIMIEKTYEVISIIHLFVLEESRNKHVGSLLLDYVLSDVKNVDRFILEVSNDNVVAINLYEKFGFKKISTRKDYYNGTDAIVMEKEVSNE